MASPGNRALCQLYRRTFVPYLRGRIPGGECPVTIDCRGGRTVGGNLLGDRCPPGSGWKAISSGGATVVVAAPVAMLSAAWRHHDVEMTSDRPTSRDPPLQPPQMWRCGGRLVYTTVPGLMEAVSRIMRRFLCVLWCPKGRFVYRTRKGGGVGGTYVKVKATGPGLAGGRPGAQLNKSWA